MGEADRARKPWEEALPTPGMGGGMGTDAALVPYAVWVACLVGTTGPQSYSVWYKGAGVWEEQSLLGHLLQLPHGSPLGGGATDTAILKPGSQRVSTHLPTPPSLRCSQETSGPHPHSPERPGCLAMGKETSVRGRTYTSGPVCAAAAGEPCSEKSATYSSPSVFSNSCTGE